MALRCWSENTYSFTQANTVSVAKKAEKCTPYCKFCLFCEIPVKMAMLSFIISLKESTNPMETRFLLADNLYCKASVPPTDKVCLWLGVSKMEPLLRWFVWLNLPEDGVHCCLSCPGWDMCNSLRVQESRVISVQQTQQYFHMLVEFSWLCF